MCVFVCAATPAVSTDHASPAKKMFRRVEEGTPGLKDANYVLLRKDYGCVAALGLGGPDAEREQEEKWMFEA